MPLIDSEKLRSWMKGKTLEFGSDKYLNIEDLLKKISELESESEKQLTPECILQQLGWWIDKCEYFCGAVKRSDLRRRIKKKRGELEKQKS